MNAIEKRIKEVEKDLEELRELLKTQPKYFTRGNRFRIDHYTYVLCQMDPDRMCLISINDGNRYRDPVRVTDVFKVTESELELMGANANKLITK